MKLKIISLLLFLLVQEQLHAQDDPLILVKLSRLQYCNAKIAEVGVMTERMLVKDSAIVLANAHADKQEEIANSFKVDNDSFKEQIGILQSAAVIKETEAKDDKKKIKSLKLQNVLLKVGGVALAVLTTYVIIHDTTE